MSSSVRVRFAHARTRTHYWFEGAGLTWGQLRARVLSRHVCRGRKNGRAHEPYVLEADPPLRDGDWIPRNAEVVLRRRPAATLADVVYVKVPAQGTRGERWTRLS